MKWKSVIKNKGLKGIHVLARKEFKEDIVKKYFIEGVPRYILIDKEGKILKPNIESISDALGEEIKKLITLENR